MIYQNAPDKWYQFAYQLGVLIFKVQTMQKRYFIFIMEIFISEKAVCSEMEPSWIAEFVARWNTCKFCDVYWFEDNSVKLITSGTI